MSEGRRICIAAENASRIMGGEALLPFQIFRRLLARGEDVHLVVHARCQSDLSQAFPHDGHRIHTVNDHWLQKLLFRIQAPFPRRIAETTFGLAMQLITQRAMRRALRRLTQPGAVVHQPVPVAPRFPSGVYNVGAPVLIGPMNGGMDYPPAFRNRDSALGRAYIRIARALTDLGNRSIPGKLLADVLLVANERTRAALPHDTRADILLIPENGVDIGLWKPATPPTTPRFVFIGRLVDWKYTEIAIEALAQLPAAELDIIGDGPELLALTRLVNQLGLTERVTFHGWLPQHESARILEHSTALVLPSLYESGGAVVLEAMASALPVIATAWGGPLDYLDETCGLLIEPSSPAALLEGFTAAMQRLAADPALAQRLGTAGRARALALYDWDAKVTHFLKLYDELLTQ